MGTLRLPGLITGIDTTDLIKQLMAINSRRLATYKVQKMAYEDKSTVLNELRSKVSALNTAAGAISDASKLGSYKASSSDTDILTVSASLDVNPGSHSILINQLATTETWIHDDSAFSYETDYVGGGKFIYSYNHQERVITAVENETTLEDMVNLINDDEENPGVTASLLYQGGKYHLMLSGQETGQDYQISINTKSTEVWKPDTGELYHTFTEDGETAALTTKLVDLDDFEENAGLKGDEFIKITGENHFGTDISPDFELDVTANTTVGHLIDAINEHFDGVATAVLVNGQICLTDHICDTSYMTISLSYDNGATGDTDLGLPTMDVSTGGGGTTADLAPFNDPDNFTKTQSAQNSEIKVNDYPTESTAELQTLSTDASPTGGTYTLTFRGETTTALNHSASPTDIKTALEALPTVGEITVEDQGGGTGLAEGNVTFTFISSLGDVSMISIDDTSLTGPTTTCSIAETIKGSNGWLNRNGNTIADALTGVTLNLHDVTETDDPIEITLTRNISGVRSKVQGMVSAYNTLMTFLRGKTEYNEQAKKMGILSTHLAVSLIKAQIRNPFDGVVTGFSSDDNFTQASDIGITVDGHGMLEFDTSEFNDAMSEDFMTALELIGVTATGHSDSASAVIEFYAANDKYTTAGTYDVEVVVEEIEGTNFITSAKIRLSTESTWRDATINNVDSLITGDSTFDDNGTGPLYPENGLQLYVDVSTTDTFRATVRVKRGFAGTLEDMLTEMLDPSGRLDINEDINDDNIVRMGNRIEDEEDRLEDIEERLIAKFTRLEKTLVLLAQQFEAISTFGFGW